MRIPIGVVEMILQMVEDERRHKKYFGRVLDDITTCYIEDGFPLTDGSTDPFYKHILKFVDIINEESRMKYFWTDFPDNDLKEHHLT